MSKTLSVVAIEQGCVIDHIPVGQAVHIVNALQLDEISTPVTLGLNLSSQRGGQKDLIKLHHKRLTEEDIDRIAIFAPGATVNHIEGFAVTEKYVIDPPQEVVGVFVCPNSQCITHQELVTSRFAVSVEAKHTQFTCHYCEGRFAQPLLRSVC